MANHSNPIMKLIAKTAQDHAEKIAIYDDQKKLTYKELIQVVSERANQLKSKGVGSGDRVAILMENKVDCIIGLLGILDSGATAVLIDPRLPLKDMHRLINFSDPFALLSTKSAMEKLDSNLIPLVSVFDLEENLSQNHDFYSGKDSSAFMDKDPELAIIMFTSGTSGAYKGVMLTDNNIIVSSGIINTCLNGAKDFYCILPVHHIYSLTGCVFNPLFHGGTVRFVNMETIFQAFQVTRPTIVPLVPRILEFILAKIQTTPALQDQIKKIDHKLLEMTSGGAPLSASVEKAYDVLGFPLTRGYGLSEVAGAAILSLPHEGILGSAGKKGEMIDVRIDHPDEKGIGEILFRGPSVMKGYFRDPEATAKAIVEGWFHTGDLGYLDKRGYLYITGRIKDVIVLPTGEKSMPDNIESYYTGIKGVKELSVFGMQASGQVWDEIHAAVILENSEINPREVETRIFEKGQKLPFQLQIQKIHFVKEIPKTSVQKVRRAVLREMIKKGTS